MTPRDVLRAADVEILGSDRLLHVAYVARRLSCHRSTIHRWIVIGRIASVRLPSGAYRIPQHELRRILTCK